MVVALRMEKTQTPEFNKALRQDTFMKSPLITLAILGILSCSPVEHKHSGQVDFKFTIDEPKMRKYFTVTCLKQDPTMAGDELETCIIEETEEFLQAIKAMANEE